MYFYFENYIPAMSEKGIPIFTSLHSFLVADCFGNSVYQLSRRIYRMANILAVLDPDKKYVRKLTAFMARQDHLPFEIQGFDSRVRLHTYMQEHKISILLLSEQWKEEDFCGMADLMFYCGLFALFRQHWTFDTRSISGSCAIRVLPQQAAALQLID